MAKLTAKQQKQEKSLELLHTYIKEGDTLTFVLTGIGRDINGNTRRKWQIFSTGVSDTGKPTTYFITKHIADLFGYKYSESGTNGMWTTSGYDELIMHISWYMFSDNYKLKAVVW